MFEENVLWRKGVKYFSVKFSEIVKKEWHLFERYTKASETRTNRKCAKHIVL